MSDEPPPALTDDQVRDQRLMRAERGRHKLLSLKLVGAAWLLIIVGTIALATIPSVRVKHQCAPQTECRTAEQRPPLSPSPFGWVVLGAALLAPGVVLLRAAQYPGSA